MNRKTLILCIAALALLTALVAVAVANLFSGKDSQTPEPVAVQKEDVTGYPLLEAVPSDAAMLFCSASLKDAVSVLTDSTHAVGSLFRGTGNSRFPEFLARLKETALRNVPAIVSVHYSGEMVPLLLFTASDAPADTSAVARAVKAAADSCGLSSAILDGSTYAPVSSRLHKKTLMLVSPSEALLTSSRSHLQGGMSVLDKEGFPGAAAAMQGKDALFFNHDYAGKFFQKYMGRGYAGVADFFSHLTRWTALAISGISAKALELSGTVSHSASPAVFMDVFARTRGGDSKMADILPATTVFALSLPLQDVTAYRARYQEYIDATRHLDGYQRESAALGKAVGMTPEKWVGSLDIKEIVRASYTGESGVYDVLLIRPGKVDPDVLLRGTGLTTLRGYKPAVLPYAYAGFAGLEFGGFFSLPEETVFTWVKDWMVIGTEKAVAPFALGTTHPLRTFLSDASVAAHMPEKGQGVVLYFSLTENPPLLDRLFSPALSRELRHTAAGISFEPVFVGVHGKAVDVTSCRVTATRSLDPVVIERDTVVVVPKGPFKVTNSGTGKVNLLSQSANGALSLREEGGKGIWSVPFSSPLCGAVATIDYYGNGKLQFLFASKDKLYLLDRLGRFVSPFPVSLGKEVLLGPAAYDFTGAHGYTAVVLHTDNTVGMYDLHGRIPDFWEGISLKETIKCLPELLEVRGKKYWVVRTSIQTLIYPFGGGEPLTRAEGDKMIRPDSPVQAGENGAVTVTCLDGKQRKIKLQTNKE